MGRWPTKGELIEYYSRDDICAVIYYQSKRWKILMEFGTQDLLEPTSERDAREKIIQKLCDFAKDVKETERLNRYPTMHILGDRGRGADVRYDLMLEDDPPSWSQAFYDMAKSLDVLDAHDVYYQIKFSGHRSLHLIIPAEAFPKTFQGKSLNEQFKAIQKRVKIYLPRAGHVNVGLRAVYSTHPRGGMVSIPLWRKELHLFRPWMANIHTVTVDFDWFHVPQDAVERNEKFLHTIFENREKNMMVPPLVFEPLPVKSYKGEHPRSFAEALEELDSSHPQERVMAARAALTQNIQLPKETLERLLHDTETDVVWFGQEIALKDTNQIAVEYVFQLLGEQDDYLVGLGWQLLIRSTEQVEALCDYLISQSEINRKTLAVARVIAKLDLSNGKGVIQSVVERGSRQIADALQRAVESGQPYDEIREYIRLLRKLCEWNDIEEITVFSESIQLLLPRLLYNLRERNVSPSHFSVLPEIWGNQAVRLWTRREFSNQVDALCDYLISQREITPNTTGVARLIATLDWQTLETLPTRIQAPSLQEWFAHMWVICGSALCLTLTWGYKPEPILENAHIQAKTYPASEEEVADKIHQLKLLLKLRNTQSYKKVEDAPLFQTADELIQYGHDLRGIVLSMLVSQHPYTACGAIRLLTRLWWDDCIDILIQQLDASKSRRKSALKALVDIGTPAVEPLMDAIKMDRNRRIVIRSMEALGQIGDTRAIPVIQEIANDPNGISFNARQVLQTHFGIGM